jgi:hypothetical protein
MLKDEELKALYAYGICEGRLLIAGVDADGSHNETYESPMV